MPSVTQPAAGKTYWRSLEDRADSPEFRRFVENEFPSFAPELLNSPSRRQFLKLMGASLALGGLTGCRWPVEKIAPYASRSDGHTPGVPLQFATAMELGGYAAGLLASSYDGRPVKIEGNPEHPINRGATDAFAQASVLELYDPDRARAVVQVEAGQAFYRSWDEFAGFARRHFDALKASGGAGLAVLCEATSSPSMAALRARFRETFPSAGWYEYEAISRDNERLGTRAACDRVLRPQYALERADVIVALDADLLMTHPAAVKHTRDFAAGRDVDASGRRRDSGRPMNRLYAVESAFTVTGAAADRRLAVPAEAVPDVLHALMLELARLGVPGERLPLAREISRSTSVDRAFVGAMARDLLRGGARGVVAVGARQPAEMHALAHAINAALGCVGTTVFYTEEPDPDRATHAEAIAALADRVQAEAVETLVIVGGNPAFDAPADLDFDRLLASVPTTVHLTLFENETSQRCAWRLPRAHYLEGWGDARAYDGTISIVQPLIEPLYGGRTPAELLALLLGEKEGQGYAIVRNTLKETLAPADFEGFWRRSLHDGVVAGSAWPSWSPGMPDRGTLDRLAGWLGNRRTPAREGTVEVVFVPDSHVYDGRFANNGWLQEMPDPLTKLTWDNAAMVSPADAERLGLRRGDVIRLAAGGRSVEIAAFVLPGQAEGSVSVPLGHGRRSVGRVGEGTGFDAYALRTGEGRNVLRGVKISRVGRRYALAVTQDHHAMESRAGEQERHRRVHELVREADLEDYVHHPDFAQHVVHHPPLLSLWEERKQDQGLRWGMTIDLNRCIGCSACVVACQAENNIPVVGKKEVDRGREMHWIRVDRYFRGEPGAPAVAHQPVTCHQCENAPCEQVCPVAATVHSDEGLNDMVYNRCIGTRYCSNNCPYKVRRFNWFNNHKERTDTEKMVFNPEVTVRSRGVMEKCTYCVQRINAVKIVAGNEGRPIRDGEIAPACAQACPARAIEFGDLNDPDSRVARSQGDVRSYAMLAELNVKPRTKYLARLRNPDGGASGSHEATHAAPPTGEPAH